MALLEVQNLCVHFPVRHGFFSRPNAMIRAVEEVSLSIDAGTAVGLVGESGCGKTTLGRAILRLVPPTSGRILLEEEDLATLSPSQLRVRRRKMQMIFQDPNGVLDPRYTIGETIGEAIDIHRLAPNREGRRARIEELLGAVGLGSELADRYPHQFSGGQRQRIGIARALAVEPRLIVCDEPVSALDVSVQAQVINLLNDLQRVRGLAYLFISHDLAVVAHLCQRVAVLYLGRLVEIGATRDVCGHPRHPYTQALLSAIPTLDPESRRRRIFLGGDLPSPLQPPAGCPFHPRCPLAVDRCRNDLPILREMTPGHFVACHLAS